MSQTNPPAPAAAPAAPVAAPTGPRERRVRFGHLALAIALVVVGALGTTALVTVVSAKGEYLAVARDIDYGAEISRDDLVKVRISNPTGIDPWPASQVHRAVGNFATMPLAAGTLLTAAHVTDEQFPTAGQVRLGITLPGDRLPAHPVRPGNLVLLVDTSDQATGEESFGVGTWEATVARVTGETDGGSILGGRRSGDTTIDILVDQADAGVIAALAANDELTVAVLPGQAGG